MSFDCIVAGSHLRYAGVWQRPQQILSRLAERVPVLLVEEPLLGLESELRRERHGNLEVVRPMRTTLAAAPIDAATVEEARAWVGARKPLVWLYTPLLVALAEAFPDAPLVYDCMDELAAFAFAPPEMAQREAALLQRADLVFAGGRSLYERRRALGEKVKLFPSGVEFEHFARAAETPPHPLFAHLPKPIYGYFGVIDERIDLTVLDALAAASEVETVLVGPVVKLDPARLPRAVNLHFTGQVAYADLPAFLAGFDVALLPFARNAATANISPTKTPEYLAGGKPVVATRVADVVADWGDVVTIADGAQAFVDACARVATEPDRAQIARGRERARTRDWNELVVRMWGELVALG
jgi:glycosyltransferase involved in cell wall biosynthesis